MGLSLSSIVQYYAKVDYYSALWYSTKVLWYTTTARFPSQYISPVFCDQYSNDSCLVQGSQ